MKKSLTLAFLFLFALSINAQKNVNIDSYRFNFAYRATPNKPQTPKLFYYSKEINLPSETKEAIGNIDEFNQRLKIAGQRIVTDTKDADFGVKLEITPLTYSSPEVKERVVESKDRDGKVTDRTYYYWIEFTYNCRGTAFFRKGNETISTHSVLNISISGRKHSTKEYTSTKDLNNNWKIQRDDIYEKLRVELANEAIESATKILSLQYGFISSFSLEMIKTINEKKHPENTKLREMADNLKVKLESMSASKGLTEDDFTEELNYFKNLANRFPDPKLKADVKLRYVGYYNVAKIYYYLDQPEKVAQYANLLIENDHDKGDGKKLIESADKLIQLFSESEIKTRHFDTDKYFKE